MHARAVTAACRHQFTRVVAVRAADDQDHLALPRQFDGGGLALFGRLANRVVVTDFGTGKPLPDQAHQVPHPFDRLRRLRGDAKARAFLQPVHVRVGEDDVELLQVFG